MNIIIKLIGLIFLLTFLLNSTTYSEGIILRNMDFKENAYYEKVLHPKAALEILLEEEQLREFPKEVPFFTVNDNDELRKDIFDCQNQIQDIRATFDGMRPKGDTKVKNKEEAFANFWKKKLRLCYLKYKKSSPTLYYEFQHMDDDKYILDSIFLTVHFISNNMSGKDKYFDNDAELGKETIVLDPNQIGVRQSFSPKTTYVIQKTIFGLELRLFTEDYWSGRFEKSRSLLDIDFQFKKVSNNENVIVNGDPFMIDL